MTRRHNDYLPSDSLDLTERIECALCDDRRYVTTHVDGATFTDPCPRCQPHTCAGMHDLTCEACTTRQRLEDFNRAGSVGL